MCLSVTVEKYTVSEQYVKKYKDFPKNHSTEKLLFWTYVVLSLDGRIGDLGWESIPTVSLSCVQSRL